MTSAREHLLARLTFHQHELPEMLTASDDRDVSTPLTLTGSQP